MSSVQTHTVLAGAAVALSLLGLSSPDSFRSLVLVPGNSLLLGEHNAWSFLTCAFVSQSMTLLALHAGTVFLLGLKSEAPGGAHPAPRVATTFAVALLAAGLLVYCLRLMLFMGSANEDYLYKAVAGCTPLAVVAGVLATEVHGDAPLHGALAVPVSQVPLCLTLLSALLQNSGLTSDTTTALVAGVVAWAYLRFFAPHAGAGGPLGDARNEFELLVFVPGPLRVALRPIEKVGSTLFMPIVHRLVTACGGSSEPLLPSGAPSVYASGTVEGPVAPAPLFGGAGGAGSAGGAGGAGAGGAGSAALLAGGAASGASDPIADRRRIKALASLDKRLAEIKQQLSGGGSVAVGGGSASPAPEGGQHGAPSASP
jgi:hypothetical protein